MNSPIDLFTVIYAGVAGLLVASFLNVAVYRLPHGETIVKGHSHCMSCGHALGALDLVPVFSYLLLGRRCRYCRAPISGRYMTIELAGGVFFTLAALLNRPFSGPYPIVSLMLLCTLFCLLLVDSMIRFDGHERTFPVMNAVMYFVAALYALLPSAAGTLADGLRALPLRLLALSAGLLAVPLLRRLAMTTAYLSHAGQHEAVPSEGPVHGKIQGRGEGLANGEGTGATAVLPPVRALPVAGLSLGLPGLLIVLPTLMLLLTAAISSRTGIPAPIAKWSRRTAPLAGFVLFALAALILSR